MLTRRLISHIFQKLSGYFSKLALWTLQAAQRFGPRTVGWKMTSHTAILNRDATFRIEYGSELADSIDRHIMGRPSRQEEREAFDVPKRFDEARRSQEDAGSTEEPD